MNGMPEQDQTRFTNSETTTQQPPAGEMEMAKANVMTAIKVLEGALPVLGSTSEEGQTVMKALTSLTKIFGESKSGEITPTQIMNMQANVPGDTMPPELMQAASGQTNTVPPELQGAVPGGGANIPPELIQQLQQGR